MKRIGVFIGVAGILAGSVGAQQRHRGPELDRLAFLAGTFDGTSRFAPPGAASQTGTMVFRGEWDLDGAILKANYEQRLGGRVVSGHLIFRWRPRDSTYAFEGYANTLMDPHRLSGRWEAGGEGRLVFEGTMGQYAFREIWEPRGRDTLVTAMEAKQGEQWVRISESVLTRTR